MNPITRAIAITCIGASLLSSGCSIENPFTLAGSTDAAPTVPAVNIAYTTASDRLNVLAGTPTVNQFASTGQPMSSMLPNVTESTLEVNYPHPQDRTGLAQVILHVGIKGTTDSSAGTWLLDIPAWQVEGIMKRLRDENFFRRAKALGSEVEMSVTQDGQNFSKRFRAVPELDALVLRTFREGTPLHSNQNASNQGHPTRPATAARPSVQRWPAARLSQPVLR